MRNDPAKGMFILPGLFLCIFLISCSPKCVVRARVVDAETRQPIKGAAVAIRRYTKNSAQRSTEPETLAAVQSLSGFTVMVAGESTDTDSGPFHEAIRSEYNLWRENLRKDFQKQMGAK